MKNLNRRQLLLGSAGTLLGLSAGCGGSGAIALPPSLLGYLLLNQNLDGTANSPTRVVAVRPDGSDQKTLLENHSLYSVSSDGQVLEVTRGNGSRDDARLYYLDGSDPTVLEGNSGSPQNVWSPDSQRLLCAQYEAIDRYQLQVFSRRGGVGTPLLKRATSLSTMGWLSNTEVVFTDLEGTYHLDLRDGSVTKLSMLPYHSPSPNGRYLLRDLQNISQFERLDLATGKTDTWPLNHIAVTTPSWTRNGDLLVLTEVSEGYAALRISPDGTAMQSFVLPRSAGDSWSYPTISRWSPDATGVSLGRFYGDFSSLEIYHQGKSIPRLSASTTIAWL